jgi:membrane fusion protein (multidrug efflux system)
MNTRMKRTHIATAAAAAGAVVLLALGGFLMTRVGASTGPAPAQQDAGVVASITSARAVRTTVPITVTAYGDVAPAQSETLSVPRAGQLVALPVVVGQRVRKGTPLARLTADPASETSYLAAQTALKLAQGESQRIQSLFRLQLATVSQVETARKAEQDAQSALDAQRKLGGGSESSTVTASFDGVVTALTAALGDRLAANAPILQLGRVDQLRVNLGIEPAQRYRVHVGDAVDLIALQSHPATDSTRAPTATGRISNVQDLVDPKTQLVNAVAQVPPAAAGPLVLGMRVQAVIATGQADGWLVPRLAVLNDDQGDYLYQVRDGVAHRLGVKRRTEVNGQAVVDGALDAALPVVALGNYELQDGMKVTETAK